MTADTEDTVWLTGKLLLAMPSMGDPRFHRAVILICAHDENGAMGLVINHRLPGVDFSNLLGLLGLASSIRVDLKKLQIPVMSGGPVEAARGFLLHSGEFRQDDTVAIGGVYGVTGTVDALKDIAGGRGPDRLLFLLGYAGWGAGQLESELQQNAWLTIDPDPDLVFRVAPDEKWALAVRKLGIDPAMLSGEAGRA